MRIYDPDTEIVVVDGIKEGEYGKVLAYNFEMDCYEIHFDNSDEPDEVWMVPVQAVVSVAEHEGDEPEFEAPGFGMDAEEFAAHVEFILTRTLDRVPTVGPADAFFGYQEFEGLTPEDALLLLLAKVEEGIAHLVQAHILISRVGVTYRTIIKEITSEPTTED